MPIEVRVVSEAAFNEWVEKTKSAGLDQANEWLAAHMAAKDKLANAEQPAAQ